MSGFAAVLSRDGRSLPSQVLEHIRTALLPAGLDGEAVWADEHSALFHAHFWTVPEDIGSEQPLVDSDGRYVLTGSLRLDNRDELHEALGRSAPPIQAPDGQLALAAFIAWGPSGVRRLVGDFSFVVYDRRERCLFAFRDVLGVRPAFHAETDRLIIVASNLAGVLAATSNHRLNLEFLQDFLGQRYERWRSQTVYLGISRLEPGHYLKAQGATLTVRRVDALGTMGPSRRVEAGEAIEGFRALFRQSVRAQLRSSSPVGILLSGGLDSSAVACQANDLVDRGASATHLRSYSAVFHRSPSADETTYLNAVLSGCRHIAPTRVACDDTSALFHFRRTHREPWDEPDVGGNRSLLRRLMAAASEDGCRVMLSGFWGDQVVGGEPYSTPWTVRDLPWLSLRKEWRHYRRRQSAFTILVKAYARPIARRLLRGTRASRAPRTVRRLGRNAELAFSQLVGPYALAMHDQFAVLGIRARMELRFPFLDRRLLEFSFALPTDVRYRDGTIKIVLREALRGLYPQDVLGRTALTHFGDLEFRGIRTEKDEVRDLLTGSALAAVGLGRPEAPVRAMEACEAEDHANAKVYRHLFNLLTVEHWLRSQRRVEARPQREDCAGIRVAS